MTNVTLGAQKDKIIVWTGYRTGSTALFNLASRILSLAGTSHTKGYIGEESDNLFSEAKTVSLSVVKAHEELNAKDLSSRESPESILILVSVRPAKEIAQSWGDLAHRSQNTRHIDDILTANISIQKQILQLPSSFEVQIFSWSSHRFRQLKQIASKIQGKNTGLINLLYLLVTTSKPWNFFLSFFESRKARLGDFSDGHAHGTLWHASHIRSPISSAFLSQATTQIFPEHTNDLIQALDETTSKIISRFGPAIPFP
jgi:hypothetical protein